MKGNIEELMGGAFLAGENPSIDIELDGIVLTPRELFKLSFEPERYEIARGARPRYNELHGRFDPFDLERMGDTVGTWSALIKRSVMTFEDAIEHAMALCALWRLEDEQVQQLSLREELDNAGKEEIEKAKVEWREAVRQRNEAMRKWDDYVAEKRARYRLLRGK